MQEARGWVWLACGGRGTLGIALEECTMKKLVHLLMPLVLLAPATNAHAQTFVDAGGTACKVSVDAVPGDTTYHWQGECKDGKAEGTGLLTSSLGGMLRGMFKSGEPYNVHGFWPLSFQGGGTVIAEFNATDGVTMWNAIDLPNAQGTLTPISSAQLAGGWTFRSVDGQCVEQHTYRPDGSALTAGGEEVMQSAYGLMQVYGKTQLFGLVKTAIASNSKPDCTGAVSPAEPDSTKVIYLQRESPDRYLTCSISDEPLNCFGRLERTAEQNRDERADFH